jgi:peptidoglycan/xylan/chitin deacetylase (PgdA/CDA1 family)
MRLLARFTDVVPASWQGDPDTASARRLRPAVAITFDDALQSVFDNALPVLERLGLQTTIFVPTGWVGQRPGWRFEGRSDATEPVASATRIAGVRKDLVTIGSHTVSHPRLSTLQAEEIETELRESREALDALMGQSTDLLAFPYGDFDEQVLRLCSKAEYRYVFTIEPGLIKPGAGAFKRGRVAVEPDDTLWEFILKTLGAYRWMPAASALKKRFRTYAGA